MFEGSASWLMRLILVTVAIAVLDSVAFSTTPITVSGDHSLTFGSLNRSSSSTISYSSGSSARFTVTGAKRRDVALAVSFTALDASNGSSGSSSNRTMTPTVAVSACKYSTDNGSNWNSFDGTYGSYIYALTTFPNASGTTSSILVRVGGVLTTGARQQRGGYAGTVTVSAQYQ